MIGSRLSIGLIFRIVDCTKVYNIDNDKLNVECDCTKLKSEVTFTNFDEEEFYEELKQL